MNFEKLNATIEYDPVYGHMIILDSEDWEKTYEEYKIIKSNYGKEEWNEIENRAAKLIQSWWFQSKDTL